MTVGELGEAALLEIIRPHVTADNNGKLSGFGDDCAVFITPPNELCVHTSDMLIEGTHFPRGIKRGHNLGRKAVVSNLSDLAAAGAYPDFISVALGLPPSLPVDFFIDFYKGLAFTCKQYKCRIVGGDVAKSQNLVISISATGWKDPSWAACRRSDSRVGDYIYLCEPLGKARVGLDALLAGVRTVEAHSNHFIQHPETNLGPFLASSMERLAMIDISDSLFHELTILCKMSEVGMEINLEKIPIHKSVKIEDLQSRAEYALFSGEEYKLVWTCPLDPVELKAIFKRAKYPRQIINIGRVNDSSKLEFLNHEGQPVQVKDQTFSHFAAV